MNLAESDGTARLCDICSKLDIQRLAHPIYPCRNPLPCSTPPTRLAFGDYLALGSIDEIKGRRSTCSIYGIVAECLDKEPSDLNGECRIRECAQFCNFNLPKNVEARDPTVTHFHLTQTSVIFDTSIANHFQGPSLPWDVRRRDNESSHHILKFQAKAMSRCGAGDLAMHSSQTEEEFFATIGGRCVVPQANVQLIRAWLRQCEGEHGSVCLPSLRLPLDGDREPSFVVDVEQWCLVDTPSRCRYVALSYVWGSAPVFRHLQENTQDLRKKGSLRMLPIPATIRDSTILVHAIGERYLWVDSICIVQNDPRMQQAEIARMGSIYSKALFTIIAAAGDHANSGLPGVQQGSREQVQKILKLANCELLTVIDVNRSARGGMEDTIWAQRAWTFQERVLSNRVLVFSESQVYWSCRAASHSEERALEEVQDLDCLRLSFPQQFARDCLSWEILQPFEYRVMYDDLLANYRERHLTYQTDILNAFNGISEILAIIQNDSFVWGLPASLFSYAMTWSFTGNVLRNRVVVPIIQSDGSKEMVPLPSWSWAAWANEDPSKPPFLHSGEGNVRPVIHFDLVDNTHQLVRIKEQSRKDDSGDGNCAAWKNEQSGALQPATQQSPPEIGQLRFWTSHANVRTIRSWRPHGLDYVISESPSSDAQLYPTNPNYRSEILHQDFIVIAASGTKLILLAIEWKDGVAYRVGKTEVGEVDWIKLENRQWRMITLG